MPEKFSNYNGNGPLMAARALVAAARTCQQFDDDDIFAALRQLQPSNEKEVRFLLDLPNHGLYDIFWESQRA